MASPQAGAPNRRSRGISLLSDKSRSHRSHGSGSNSLSETHDEKAHRKLTTKADPTLAMNEAQPMTVAFEKSTLTSLRDIPHKDQYGNLITEPDLSNPTRPRFERPLDTIRSFEAAIYGTYASQRLSFVRTDEGEYNGNGNGNGNGRGSYAGGPNGPPAGRYDQGGYNGRGNQSRPTSYIDAYSSNQQADSYYPYNQGNQGTRPRPPRHSPRTNSEQAYGGYQNGYQQYGPQGGNNPEQWNGYNDPNYTNGQTDQEQQMYDRAGAEYGFQGFGPGPNVDYNVPPTSSNGGQYNSAPSRHPYDKPLPDSRAGGPPAAPVHRFQNKPTNSSDKGDKRKSWFKRRFSKN